MSRVSGVHVAEELSGVLSQAPLSAEAHETPLFILMRDGIAPLARHFGISARTLRRHCARAGLRLDVQRRALRRELVMILLATDLPISDVAHRLGYASSKTLARFLKKTFGATATHMKRRMRPRVGLEEQRPSPGEARTKTF